MYIGGFQKNSLIDFPGTIACVVFTRGCNFICPYCHNPDLVAGSALPHGDDGTGNGIQNQNTGWNQQEILSFLEKRKGMLEGVVITGGEPTLQADLEGFINTLRQMGYKIKLDTNGTRPKIVGRILDQHLVDYIAMDVKTDPDHYSLVMKQPDQLNRVMESIALIMTKAPAYEFRTTCARPFVSPEIMKNIGEMIRGAASYVLQPCSRDVAVLDYNFTQEENHFLTQGEIEELKAAISPYVPNTRIR